jgi:beta-lactamase regulating signal transducer with metallopeptidase domain
VVLAFAGALCLAWRRAAAATRHLIWFCALASLPLLPLLPFLLPTAQRPLWSVSGGLTAGNQISLAIQLDPSRALAANPPQESTRENPSTSQPHAENGKALFTTHLNHNWLTIAFALWAGGLSLTLLYPLLGQFQLRKISRKARRLETLEWTRLLIEASETLELRRPVWLFQSAENVMPLTWGWLFPKVLMPAEADRWSPERRRIVLLHELAHVKRWDCLTQNIARVVCALYWFNPLTWLAARQMRIERERACDDLVLNGGCKASDYAGHLVQIATTFRRAPQAAGIAMARSSNLEQRVTAIVDASRARRLQPAGMVGILISIGAVIFYIGGYKTSAANDDKSSTVNQQTLAQLEKFGAEKEAQAKILAAVAGEKIVPQFQKYFDAAKKGDYRTITNMFADFKVHHPQYERAQSQDSRPAYRTSYWQPMLEIGLVYDQFAMCDSKYTQAAADNIINSIPPGSIFFGGTDPGRGLPTAFSKSHVDADPFYTISQNPLADSTYEDYLRKMYGEKRRTLAQFAAARQADPELARLDQQYQAALQKALTLEMSKPANDPARMAADKAVEDLSSNIDLAMTRVEKSINPNENSADANSWSNDKVIYIPTQDDVLKCFQDYCDEAKKRKDENKLKPGEEVKVDENGKVQVSGQIAVMTVNAGIAKIIFDKNPNREFYVEESFPLDWMYPHLEPNGLIMKINREPLAELPDDVIQKDQDYWQTRVNAWLGDWLTPDTSVETVADFAAKVYGRKNLSGFTGDPGFIQDNYAGKMFSKWRSGIAGVYSWRLAGGYAELPPEYAPKNDAEKQKLTHAADFAFKQAFAMCPASPEAVFRYINFLMKQGRMTDALAVAHAAAIVDPKNEIFRTLEKNIPQQPAASASPPASTAKSASAEQVQELQDLLTQKESEYVQKKAEFEKLKALDHEALKKALPIAAPDTQLNELLSELDLAEQELDSLQEKYTQIHPRVRVAQAAVDDLNRKVDARMEGIMLGLETRVAFSKAYAETIRTDLEKLKGPVQRGL